MKKLTKQKKTNNCNSIGTPSDQSRGAFQYFSASFNPRVAVCFHLQSLWQPVPRLSTSPPGGQVSKDFATENPSFTLTKFPSKPKKKIDVTTNVSDVLDWNKNKQTKNDAVDLFAA